MGRKRKDNSLNLPPRVYAKHGAFYYVHPDGRWERIGTDAGEARQRGNLYNDPDNEYGKMSYWLGMFLIHCEERTRLERKKGGLAMRTYEDYKKTLVPLKAFFGKMHPTQVKGHHVGSYLDIGLKTERGVRANREKATLSACFSWLMRQEDSGVTSNPCIGIRRNPESKRERYVTHDEYEAVTKTAGKQLRSLLELIYRTLQRPEDIIEWTPANIINKRESNGETRKVIRNDQSKRMGNGGKVVDILVTPEIQAALDAVSPEMPIKLGPGATFIRNNKGKPYTYSGLTSNLSNAIRKAKIQKFGLYDMKAKGATDMWRDGEQLELIQVLCGHESITTTEIYVKSRWVDTVEPNRVKLAG